MASPAPSNAHSLAEQYMPLARSLARWLCEQIYNLDREEVEADGFLGLVKAEKRYDPGIGVSFPRYARKFILGAMRDGVQRNAFCGSIMTDACQVIDSAAEDPADLAERADDVDYVRDNLGREPFERAKSPGLTGRAIAERAGITPAGASQRVSRARKILADMEREGAECN